MATIKVNVIIAGRTYPLSVNNADEEEGMRKAAKELDFMNAARLRDEITMLKERLEK